MLIATKNKTTKKVVNKWKGFILCQIKKVICTHKAVSDDEHIYSKFNIMATEKAAKELSDRAFKLYVRLNLNKDGFTFALSPALILKEIGVKDDTCRRAVKELISKGYLIETDRQANFFDFFELPAADMQEATADMRDESRKCAVDTSYNTIINKEDKSIYDNAIYLNDEELHEDEANAILEDLANRLSDCKKSNKDNCLAYNSEMGFLVNNSLEFIDDNMPF